MMAFAHKIILLYLLSAYQNHWEREREPLLLANDSVFHTCEASALVEKKAEADTWYNIFFFLMLHAVLP